jgi:hypothetical protein
MDVKQASYNNAQIDRQIVEGTESVEALTQRKFYPADATRKFDWPDYSLSPPWKLYLDADELAAQPTLVQTGTTTIPSGNYLLYPVNTGPPYTRLELKRSSNSAFGASNTPQQDISIQGTFGYWTRTVSAGALAAQISSTSATQITVNAAGGAGIGVGDVLICESERMLVQDSLFVSTGISFSSGASTASANDNLIAVPDGTQFVVDEVLRIDFEWMLVQDIVGNVLVVKRAWGGSVLVAHSPGTISARRSLTVLRGQLGTTSATHANATPLAISQVPALVKDLALAEALVGMTQEPGSYGQSSFAGWYGQNSRTQGQQREPGPGVGIADLRIRCYSKYARCVRSRVV